MSELPEDRPYGAPPPRFVSACALLRAKTMYYRAADQAQPPGMIADSPTLSYWCARTRDHVGPDHDGCDPRRCQAARVCFVPPAALA